MIHSRIASKRVVRLLAQFPAVAILGPRQIGKSTLARSALAGYRYLDLENAGDLRLVEADPLFVLSQQRKLILDEAQALPAVFPILRGFLDEHPRHRVALLGSASPHLVKAISESLAGRAAFLDLGGISVFEQRADALWVRGGYPRVHWSRPRSRPEEWYPAYLRASIEQDIPRLGFRISSRKIHNLLTMVAHSQGRLCNLSELGSSLGMTYHTVDHVLDILEGVFLVRRLPPFSANLKKRLVRSPKLYVRDTGVLHSLLGIPHVQRDLLAHPKAGASFETFCIEQIIAHARLVDPAAQAYFYRTRTGTEVDLVLEIGSRRIPIEIKMGITAPDVTALKTCMRDLGLRDGYVVNRTNGPLEISPGIVMCGLVPLLEQLELRPG